MIQTREEIPTLLKPNSIGCEIGIFEGGYSRILANSGKFSQLYLVDLFSGMASSGDKFGNNIKTYSDASILLKYNQQQFVNYNFIEVIQSDSVSFLSNKTNFFDFIYIDTVHDYNYTLKELEASYVAAKVDGYIAGHDYNEYHYPGLVRAVQEFCKKYQLSFYTTKKDFLESYIIKKS